MALAAARDGLVQVSKSSFVCFVLLVFFFSLHRVKLSNEMLGLYRCFHDNVHKNAQISPYEKPSRDPGKTKKARRVTSIFFSFFKQGMVGLQLLFKVYSAEL